MASEDPSPQQQHEWQRTVVGWHLAFGMLAAITALLVIADTDPLPLRILALSILALLCVWYCLIGARTLHHDPSTRGVLFVIVSMVLTITMYAVSTMGAVMFFILYPHFWALLARRWAMVCTVLSISATGAVIFWHWEGPDEGGVFAVVLLAAVAILFSLALGLWITRIIEQSTQRAELLEQLSKAQSELAEAERRAGASAERERLARDIHDTLAQGFASVVLLIDSSQRDIGSADEQVRENLTRAAAIARENLAEAREMIATLTPPALHQASLPDALRQVVNRMNTPQGPACVVTVEGEPRPLSSDHETAILRIVQEGITNSCKHSAAQTVRATLTYEPQRVRLRVRDDGQGFEPDEALAGYGLPGMRQRASLAGGRFRIDAATGSGVTIEAEFAT